MSKTKNILRKNNLSGKTLDQLCVYARQHPKKENIIKNDIRDINCTDPYINKYSEKDSIKRLFKTIGIYSFLLAYTNKELYTFVVRYINGKLDHFEINKNVSGEHLAYRDAVAVAIEHFIAKTNTTDSDFEIL